MLANERMLANVSIWKNASKCQQMLVNVIYQMREKFSKWENASKC